jgi:hypothetical protein
MFVTHLPDGFGVASREVLVRGHHQRTFPRQRVQIGRQRRRQRFAFARSHFGEPSVAEHHAPDELHVVVPKLEHTPGRLPHHLAHTFKVTAKKNKWRDAKEKTNIHEFEKKKSRNEASKGISLE